MNIIAIVEFVKVHWLDISNVIVSVIGIASIIVRLTPSVNDDKILAKIVAFVSKYLALNTPTK